MRISDWSSDVCSSDLASPTEGCWHLPAWREVRLWIGGGGKTGRRSFPALPPTMLDNAPRRPCYQRVGTYRLSRPHLPNCPHVLLLFPLSTLLFFIPSFCVLFCLFFFFSFFSFSFIFFFFF